MGRELDLLLSWLTTRVRISDRDARAACFELRPDDNYPVLLGELQRSGHVEREEHGWRVVQACMVWRGGQIGSGEFYGARDEKLRSAFSSAGVPILCLPREDGVQKWQVHGERSHVRKTAEALGVSWFADPSLKLLRALPNGSEVLEALEPEAFGAPRGRCWRRYSLECREKPREGLQLEQGLWQSLTPLPVVYLWVDHLGIVRRLERREHQELARWQLAGAAIRIQADGLRIPMRPRLPVLVDRALRIACGGQPGSRENKQLFFRLLSQLHQREVLRILAPKRGPIDA